VRIAIHTRPYEHRLRMGKADIGASMGSAQRASCQCGFLTDISAAGDMSCHLEDTRFPFYCAHCGLVEVNTALDVPVCPRCGTADIAQYGKPPVSVVPSHKYPAAPTYSLAGSADNLCPACKKMTLIFS